MNNGNLWEKEPTTIYPCTKNKKKKKRKEILRYKFNKICAGSVW